MASVTSRSFSETDLASLCAKNVEPKTYTSLSQPLPSTALTECAICIDQLINPVQLACAHAFCSECLESAAASKLTSCPLCRRKTVLNPSRASKRERKQRERLSVVR